MSPPAPRLRRALPVLTTALAALLCALAPLPAAADAPATADGSADTAPAVGDGPADWTARPAGEAPTGTPGRTSIWRAPPARPSRTVSR